MSILIVGTADTKADELLFIQRCIEQRVRAGSSWMWACSGARSSHRSSPTVTVAAAANTTYRCDRRARR